MSQTASASESESLPVLCTKAEVAKFFRVSERQVSNWMKKRSLDYVKMGRSVRFPKEAIFEMVKKLTIKRKI